MRLEYYLQKIIFSSMGWMSLNHFSFKWNNFWSMCQGLFWNHKVLSCLAQKCGMHHSLCLFDCMNCFIVVAWAKFNVSFWVWQIYLVQPCSNPDCLYLHEVGPQEDSFSKDEIISAYTRYMNDFVLWYFFLGDLKYYLLQHFGNVHHLVLLWGY